MSKSTKSKGKTAPKEVKTKSCLLMLVGLPGAGKSTVATELEKHGKDLPNIKKMTYFFRVA